MTTFLVVMVLWYIFFDVVYLTIFKIDVMMMKYIVWVETPLMFDINKTNNMTSRGRENQLVDEDEGKGGETEEEIIRRRVFSNLKNSSLQQSLKLVQFICGLSALSERKTALRKAVDYNTV